MEFLAGFQCRGDSFRLGAVPWTHYSMPLRIGSIQGIVGLVGCNNPKITQDYGHITLTEELIKQDILVVETGCAAIASAKRGLLLPEAAQKAAPACVPSVKP